MCKCPLIGEPFPKYDCEKNEWKWKYRFYALKAGNFDPRPCTNPRTGEVREKVLVSCGQCVECRLKYAKDWADRCMMEASLYPDDTNWFITLTYDPVYDDLLKNPETGMLSLKKDHLTAFEKALRQVLARAGIQSAGVRFFSAGEYGDAFGRPHWHCLVFNAPLPDANIFAHNKLGDPLYHSALIEKAWKYGFAVLGKITWQSASYTARYVMKKRKGKEKSYYDAAGIEPEFTRMSRNPGIGKEFIDANIEYLESHSGIAIPGSSGRLLNGGRYMRSRLSDHDPIAFWRKQKAEKEVMDDMTAARRVASSLSDAQYFSLRGSEREKVGKILAQFRKNMS